MLFSLLLDMMHRLRLTVIISHMRSKAAQTHLQWVALSPNQEGWKLTFPKGFRGFSSVLIA